MGNDEIRRLTSNGFRPFTLHLSNGRFFDVPHPEFIAFSRRVVVVMGHDGLPNIIDPLHIVSVNAKPAKAKPKR